jgi:hypothetical protein
MTDIAFPKPPKRNRKNETLQRRQDLATFKHQVLAADGYRCAVKGCKCDSKNGLHAHHIVYRSHEGSDDISNGITLCPVEHDKVHNGTRILGVLYTGRAYMLMILRSHKGDKNFRWQEAMGILERRYA